ncbi:MAG: electron transfer flavoprotein alpha subunit [Actinomycetota bacterium]|jgi:electron transfer flavoprotein alpha subunit|nr:electron transfer flavoprotein alpha subunit [Actinomycetota bacterium]
MSLVVFLEHHEHALSPGSLGVLTKAAALDPDVAAVLVGDDDLAPLAREAGRYGAATVFTAVDTYASPLPGPRIDVLAELLRLYSNFDTILFSNSVLAADVAAGLAARLDAGINWDLVDLEFRDGQPIGKQPMLQESELAEVGWRSPQRIALFRAGSFEAVASATEREPTVESLTVAFAERTLAARVIERALRADEGPSLADADVIVAGGIGLGSAEGFELAEELAAVLGGTVGATRAAVYKGWYPASAQIGQTGKTVSPKLYVALGVSGAVQHKVGMQSSKTIVAINKDPHAPIFEFSDIAVVGDVHTIVPELVELLRKHAG